KDSLNNQFKTEDGRTIEIPPTLLITGIGIVPDLDRCVTMDAKTPGNVLLQVCVDRTIAGFGGSHVAEVLGFTPGERAVIASPERSAEAAAAVASLIARGRVVSAHDCSEGGALVAIAEMLIASGIDGCGCDVELTSGDPLMAAFAEGTARYILEVRPQDTDDVMGTCQAAGLDAFRIGTLNATARLRSAGLDLAVAELHRAWTGTLDW
ncbi:MAG: hypothetical protein KDA21_13485, partial [Phycisphaerales bacterium]|nr:hypothetical protein [Phycisphaerales bacterium]